MAQIPANISELVGSITNTGLAYSNRYEVFIPFPPNFPSQNTATIRDLTVRCDSVSIPGRSFSTTPFRFYGPARNMPYEQIYSGEMTLSVMVSEDLRERNFFETWMGLVASRADYKFAFYDQYTTNIIVNILNRSDAPTYSFVIEETYPKMIGDLQVGYDKDNEFLRQDVTLCFRKYTPTYIGIPAPVVPPPGSVEGPPIPHQAAVFVNNGGRLDRVGFDGTVNGIYDPSTANRLLVGQGSQPNGFPPRNNE